MPRRARGNSGAGVQADIIKATEGTRTGLSRHILKSRLARQPEKMNMPSDSGAMCYRVAMPNEAKGPRKIKGRRAISVPIYISDPEQRAAVKAYAQAQGRSESSLFLEAITEKMARDAKKQPKG